MTYADLAQQTLVENSLLTLLMEGLRKILAWKVEGADFARKLSTLRFNAQSFQRHLERVLALEEYDGYMDLALQANPRLSQTVDGLRREHDQFRKEIRQIVHRLERVAPTSGDLFARICTEFDGLLTRLEMHNQQESNVMQEAFARDEGGQG